MLYLVVQTALILFITAVIFFILGLLFARLGRRSHVVLEHGDSDRIRPTRDELLTRVSELEVEMTELAQALAEAAKTPRGTGVTGLSPELVQRLDRIEAQLKSRPPGGEVVLASIEKRVAEMVEIRVAQVVTRQANESGGADADARFEQRIAELQRQLDEERRQREEEGAALTQKNEWIQREWQERAAEIESRIEHAKNKARQSAAQEPIDFTSLTLNEDSALAAERADRALSEVQRLSDELSALRAERGFSSLDRETSKELPELSLVPEADERLEVIAEATENGQRQTQAELEAAKWELETKFQQKLDDLERRFEERTDQLLERTNSGSDIAQLDRLVREANQRARRAEAELEAVRAELATRGTAELSEADRAQWESRIAGLEEQLHSAGRQGKAELESTRWELEAKYGDRLQQIEEMQIRLASTPPTTVVDNSAAETVNADRLRALETHLLAREASWEERLRSVQESMKQSLQQAAPQRVVVAAPAPTPPPPAASDESFAELRRELHELRWELARREAREAHPPAAESNGLLATQLFEQMQRELVHLREEIIERERHAAELHAAERHAAELQAMKQAVEQAGTEAPPSSARADDEAFAEIRRELHELRWETARKQAREAHPAGSPEAESLATKLFEQSQRDLALLREELAKREQDTSAHHLREESEALAEMRRELHELRFEISHREAPEPRSIESAGAEALTMRLFEQVQRDLSELREEMSERDRERDALERERTERERELAERNEARERDLLERHEARERELAERHEAQARELAVRHEARERELAARVETREREISEREREAQSLRLHDDHELALTELRHELEALREEARRLETVPAPAPVPPVLVFPPAPPPPEPPTPKIDPEATKREAAELAAEVATRGIEKMQSELQTEMRRQLAEMQQQLVAWSSEWKLDLAEREGRRTDAEDTATAAMLASVQRELQRIRQETGDREAKQRQIDIETAERFTALQHELQRLREEAKERSEDRDRSRGKSEERDLALDVVGELQRELLRFREEAMRVPVAPPPVPAPMATPVPAPPSDNDDTETMLDELREDLHDELRKLRRDLLERERDEAESRVAPVSRPGDEGNDPHRFRLEDFTRELDRLRDELRRQVQDVRESLASSLDSRSRDLDSRLSRLQQELAVPPPYARYGLYPFPMEMRAMDPTTPPSGSPPPPRQGIHIPPAPEIGAPYRPREEAAPGPVKDEMRDLERELAREREREREHERQREVQRQHETELERERERERERSRRLESDLERERAQREAAATLARDAEQRRAAEMQDLQRRFEERERDRERREKDLERERETRERERDEREARLEREYQQRLSELEQELTSKVAAKTEVEERETRERDRDGRDAELWAGLQRREMAMMEQERRIRDRELELEREVEKQARRSQELELQMERMRDQHEVASASARVRAVAPGYGDGGGERERARLELLAEDLKGRIGELERELMRRSVEAAPIAGAPAPGVAPVVASPVDTAVTTKAIEDLGRRFEEGQRYLENELRERLARLEASLGERKGREAAMDEQRERNERWAERMESLEHALERLTQRTEEVASIATATAPSPAELAETVAERARRESSERQWREAADRERREIDERMRAERERIQEQSFREAADRERDLADRARQVEIDRERQTIADRAREEFAERVRELDGRLSQRFAQLESRLDQVMQARHDAESVADARFRDEAKEWETRFRELENTARDREHSFELTLERLRAERESATATLRHELDERLDRGLELAASRSEVAAEATRRDLELRLREISTRTERLGEELEPDSTRGQDGDEEFQRTLDELRAAVAQMKEIPSLPPIEEVSPEPDAQLKVVQDELMLIRRSMDIRIGGIEKHLSTVETRMEDTAREVGMLQLNRDESDGGEREQLESRIDEAVSGVGALQASIADVRERLDRERERRERETAELRQGLQQAAQARPPEPSVPLAAFHATVAELRDRIQHSADELRDRLDGSEKETRERIWSRVEEALGQGMKLQTELAELKSTLGREGMAKDESRERTDRRVAEVSTQMGAFLTAISELRERMEMLPAPAPAAETDERTRTKLDDVVGQLTRLQTDFGDLRARSGRAEEELRHGRTEMTTQERAALDARFGDLLGQLTTLQGTVGEMRFGVERSLGDLTQRLERETSELRQGLQQAAHARPQEPTVPLAAFHTTVAELRDRIQRSADELRERVDGSERETRERLWTRVEEAFGQGIKLQTELAELKLASGREGAAKDESREQTDRRLGDLSAQMSSFSTAVNDLRDRFQRTADEVRGRLETMPVPAPVAEADERTRLKLDEVVGQLARLQTDFGDLRSRTGRAEEEQRQARAEQTTQERAAFDARFGELLGQLTTLQGTVGELRIGVERSLTDLDGRLARSEQTAHERYSARIAEMASGVTRTQAETAELRSRLEREAAENRLSLQQALQQRSQDTSAQFAAFHTTVADLRDRIQQSAAELRDRFESSDKETRERLWSRVEEVFSQMTKLQADVIELRSSLSAQAANTQALAGELRGRFDLLASVPAPVLELDERTRERLDETTTQLGAMHEAVGELRERLTESSNDLRERFERADHELRERMRERLDAALSSMAQMQKDMGDLRMRAERDGDNGKAKMQEQLGEIGTHVDALHAAVGELRERFEREGRDARERTRERLQAIFTDVAAVREELGQMRQRFERDGTEVREKLHDRIEGVLAHLGSIQGEITEMRADAPMLLKLADTLRERDDELELKVSRLEATLADHRHRVEDDEREMRDRLHDRVEGVLAHIASLQAEMRELKDEAGGLASDRAQMRARLEDVDAESERRYRQFQEKLTSFERSMEKEIGAKVDELRRHVESAPPTVVVAPAPAPVMAPRSPVLVSEAPPEPAMPRAPEGVTIVASIDKKLQGMVNGLEQLVDEKERLISELADQVKHLAEIQAQNPDDLEEISGIGPKLKRRLKEEFGIVVFKDLACIAARDLQRLSESLLIPDRIFSEDWIGQARDLHMKKYNELLPVNDAETLAKLKIAG